MNNPTIEKGFLLLEQRRFNEAEAEARQALLDVPEDPRAHILLVQALLGRGAFAPAREAASHLVGMLPDHAISHYLLAEVHFAGREYGPSRLALDEAISLDPEDPDFFALSARLWFKKSQWQQALDEAQRGLQLDPEHDQLNNLRAHALNQLNQSETAGQSLRASLHHNPENADTHAMLGWTALRQGKSAEAMAHFRTALSLDPSNEHARLGLIEAIKARNFIYSLLLKYFFFMSRLTPGQQWGILIGGFFAQRIARNVLEANGQLLAANMVTGVYITLVMATWIAEPLSNLFLRLHPLGRFALDDEQKKGANLLGLALLLPLAFFASASALNLDALYTGALAATLLCIPVAFFYQFELLRNRRVVRIFAGIGYALLVASIAALLFHSEELASVTFLFATLVGGIFTWFGNFFVQSEA